MPRKIFITYKYGDRDVQSLPSGGLLGTTARHYVDELQAHLDAYDHINKGENDDESLAGFKDEAIESKLRDKIFDSSITIVLISKNMKDPYLKEEDQWMPWEISYSLKEMTRGDRTSGTNGIIAVVLPDRTGSYEYFVKNICLNGCRLWQTNLTFEIIGKNMFNHKDPKTFNCAIHPNHMMHMGNEHSYIHPVKWGDFIPNMNAYFDFVTQLSENLDKYNLAKVV